MLQKNYFLLGHQKGNNIRVKLSAHSITTLSKRMSSLKSYFPVEINRKPRDDPIRDLPRWKATEFRTFLIYIGVILIQGIVDMAIYEHFLLLHCAITIILSAYHIKHVGLSLPRKLLTTFVPHSKEIYGIEFLVYNVHSLCHLTDDVQRYGPLDNFSAFPFESNFVNLKKLIHSPKKPLQQIIKRILEETQSIASEDASLRSNDTRYQLQHFSGPSIIDLNVLKQYKKIYYNGWQLSTCTQRDSYFMTKNQIVVHLENIVVDSENKNYLIGKRFTSYKDYYEYPLPY